ncbi:MAG: helix-turn-helix domain-containing protein [Ruminococcus sp.]|nr:helix-turn-helix domain-containing protein [Ruminococcus sp.]MBQ8571920.1 helix-turn-helix domain-containing protein [Ruminococcus sp.]
MEMFYSCEQVADRYGVKISTVWAWIREKKLPAVKIGRTYKVKAEDLEAFEKSNQTIADE